MSLLILIAGCVAPLGGGGETPEAVGGGVPAEGPWTDVDPWSTVVPAAGEHAEAAVGDFNGDGDADLAVMSGASDVIIEFWFGPLVAGALTVGTASTRIEATYSLGMDFKVVGDIDQDGAEDLLVGTQLVRAPVSGVTAAAADVQIAHTGAYPWPESAFGDIDGDGWIDAVVEDDVIWIVYGPLTGDVSTGEVDLQSGVPGNRTWLRWDEGCVGFTLDVLADLDADGAAEVRAGGRPTTESSSCEGPNPHHIWSPANARGQELTTAHAVLTGLPPAALGPDLDGDGVRDLVGSSGGAQVWSTAGAVSNRALGAPLLDVAFPQAIAAVAPGDFTGDGASEAFAGVAYHDGDTHESYTVVLLSPHTGAVELDVTVAGSLVDADLAAATGVPDLTGDGVPDLMAGSTLMVFDVAALIQALGS